MSDASGWEATTKEEEKEKARFPVLSELAWNLTYNKSSYGSKVHAFFRAMGFPVGKSPGLRKIELWKSLLAEEANETFTALDKEDLEGTVDGLVDITYICVGFLVTLGVDPDVVFAEVHRTNMLKSTGPKRADGKQLKPEGWKPPRIKEILAEMTDKSHE